MRQYSSDQVKVGWTFAGDLTPGLASGTFIQPVRNRPTWRQKPDGMGNTIRMFNPDASGALTLLMDGESREHQLLMTLANTDRRLQTFVAPLLVRDLNTREVWVFNKSYIATTPDVPKGVAGAIVPWLFLFQSVIQQSFGFNRNVVGD